MKRALFVSGALGTVAVAAGCGHSGVLSGAVPASGIAPAAVVHHPSSRDTVPARPLPARVLANPIVGEAARFDGPAAPAGWMIANGQTLSATQYPLLLQVLGRTNGGDGKTTIVLPKRRAYQYIIAVSGTIPKDPRALALMRPGRQMPFGVSIPDADVRPGPRYRRFRLHKCDDVALAVTRVAEPPDSRNRDDVTLFAAVQRKTCHRIVDAVHFDRRYRRLDRGRALHDRDVDAGLLGVRVARDQIWNRRRGMLRKLPAEDRAIERRGALGIRCRKMKVANLSHVALYDAAR